MTAWERRVNELGAALNRAYDFHHYNYRDGFVPLGQGVPNLSRNAMDSIVYGPLPGARIGDGWLENELIDFIVHQDIRPRQGNSTHVLLSTSYNSFLHWEQTVRDFQGTNRVPPALSVDFGHGMVTRFLLPVHIRGNHWILLDIDAPGGLIRIYDSNSSAHATQLNVTGIIRMIRSIPRFSHIDQWSTQARGCAQQTNDRDCGPLMMETIEDILQGDGNSWTGTGDEARSRTMDRFLRAFRRAHERQQQATGGSTDPTVSLQRTPGARSVGAADGSIASDPTRDVITMSSGNPNRSVRDRVMRERKAKEGAKKKK